MTLKFLPEGQVPESPGDLIAREAWVGRLAAAVLLLSLGCAVPVLLGALLLDQGVGGWRLELSFDSLFGLAYYGTGDVDWDHDDVGALGHASDLRVEQLSVLVSVCYVGREQLRA